MREQLAVVGSRVNGEDLRGEIAAVKRQLRQKVNTGSVAGLPYEEIVRRVDRELRGGPILPGKKRGIAKRTTEPRLVEKLVTMENRRLGAKHR